LFQITIPQHLLGDFCNNIGAKQTFPSRRSMSAFGGQSGHQRVIACNHDYDTRRRKQPSPVEVAPCGSFDPNGSSHSSSGLLPSRHARMREQILTGVNVHRLARLVVYRRAEEKKHDAMRMQEAEVYDYARQLLEAHGDKAVAEAAQKASALEKQGDSEQAETWRHIEAALKLMRGPHES
jgi:hypothetical protein